MISSLRRSRAPLLAAGLGVATVCLRLPGAHSSSFWQDEVASARVLQQPTFGAMLGRVARTESTPPLWYAMGWMLHRAGVSIHDVRLFSVALDGMIVAGLVMLANSLLGPVLAVAAGSVAAITAQLSAHGRELRAYELFALLALAFAASLDRAALRPDPPRLALVGGVVTAGLLTHYFFAFTVAAAAVWVVFEPLARPARRRLLAAVAAGCCLAAPWAPWFLRQFHADRYAWIGPFSPATVLATPLRILQPALASPPADLALLVWLVAAAILAARTGARARMVVALALLPIVLAALTWALGTRVYAVRNLIGTAPFLTVLLLAPLARVRPRTGLAAATAVLTIFAAAYAVDQFKPEVPYKGLAAALVADGWHRSSPVAVVGGPHALVSPLEWYLPGAPDFIRPTRLRRDESQVFAVLGARSPARTAVRDAIEVDGWLVGKLPTRELRNPRAELTLLATLPSAERTLAVHPATKAHARPD